YVSSNRHAKPREPGKSGETGAKSRLEKPGDFGKIARGKSVFRKEESKKLQPARLADWSFSWLVWNCRRKLWKRSRATLRSVRGRRGPIP
ncbi:MAG: hypothetical protein N2C14_17855, partial [Planctomycetales bacterium]